jgi:hypothetical protein
MKARIVVDERELKLNRFITDLTSNIIEAIARSLKFTEGNVILFRLQQEDLAMYVDGKEVSLQLGNASHIIGDLFRGLLRNLHGAENAKEVQFICERTS